MEPLKPLSLLFHMLMFLIYQCFISLISDLYMCYIRLEDWHVIHITIFAAIQGIGCEINCLNFCTPRKGVCTDLFSISDYVCRSDFDIRNKHLDNAPTSSVDEIQRVSPLPSCGLYTLVHDHGVHDFFSNSFIQKQFSQLIKVKMKIC